MKKHFGKLFVKKKEETLNVPRIILAYVTHPGVHRREQREICFINII